MIPVTATLLLILSIRMLHQTKAVLQTLSKAVTSELVVEKSKFIVNAISVQSIVEANAFIKHVSQSKANHNCYAYKLSIGDGYEKVYDDGEPVSTAGRPILSAIQACKLTNVCVVVTRYFGGIKLGTGGLARAYGNSARECLILGDIQEIIEMCELNISVPLTYIGNLHMIITNNSVERLLETYGDNNMVTIRVSTPVTKVEHISKDIIHSCKGKGSVTLVHT